RADAADRVRPPRPGPRDDVRRRGQPASAGGLTLPPCHQIHRVRLATLRRSVLPNTLLRSVAKRPVSPCAAEYYRRAGQSSGTRSSCPGAAPIIFRNLQVGAPALMALAAVPAANAADRLVPDAGPSPPPAAGLSTVGLGSRSRPNAGPGALAGSGLPEASAAPTVIAWCASPGVPRLPSAVAKSASTTRPGPASVWTKTRGRSSHVFSAAGTVGASAGRIVAGTRPSARSA